MKLKNNFVGLFKVKDYDELFFKSEYGKTVEKNNRVFVQHDAYCVSSGEYFWGGAKTSLEREELRVYPISYEDVKLALEKQTPKKPLSEEQFYGNGKCPCCNAVFLDKLTKYCGNCGQALDWS